eukprot:m.276583 g.276583  ORF g.276583 m.276583 type:complete len:74 (+) comp15713_c2_seq3:7957-8178(+)
MPSRTVLRPFHTTLGTRLATHLNLRETASNVPKPARIAKRQPKSCPSTNFFLFAVAPKIFTSCLARLDTAQPR